ncbi:MAG: EVE domain-containing protein [Lentilitoribacter sp.]
MAFWLFKSEPSAWSWDDQVVKGDVGEEWDGVRNYQARNFMRDMEIGELGFFYHSQKEKSVVGIVEIIQKAHPDSTTDDDRWECVDIRAVKPVKTPVSLEMIKNKPELADMALLRSSRLSVQPVRANEWDLVCKMAGVTAG